MLGNKLHDRQPGAAIMDVLQSVSGLFLALFMWLHMFMVSSILLGKDAMLWITKMFEGEPIFGRGYPIIVSLFAVFILSLVMLHAFLAMRKFPATYRQYRTLNEHAKRFAHPDTWLWYIQVVTGFLLFFLVAVHLYQLIMHPADIGPYASSDRVWSGRMWPLYLVMLFAVELHGGIGLYRLAVKWGWFMGKDPRQGRKRLVKLKWALTIFFIVLGLATLAAYMKIGYEHADRVGERYQSSMFITPAPLQQGVC